MPGRFFERGAGGQNGAGGKAAGAAAGAGGAAYGHGDGERAVAAEADALCGILCKPIIPTEKQRDDRGLTAGIFRASVHTIPGGDEKMRRKPPHDDAPDVHAFFGNPDSTFDVINQFGTYNIQPTADTTAEPGCDMIARVLRSLWQRDLMRGESLRCRCHALTVVRRARGLPPLRRFACRTAKRLADCEGFLRSAHAPKADIPHRECAAAGAGEDGLLFLPCRGAGKIPGYGKIQLPEGKR